jgi:hypothetical protein
MHYLIVKFTTIIIAHMKKRKLNKKKELKFAIIQTLVSNFDSLKDQLGEKKFNRNIKKAGKALATGLKPAPLVKKTKKTKVTKSAEIIQSSDTV